MADPKATGHSGYHSSEGFGSFMVDWLDSDYEPGWYWAAGMNGFLPDGDYVGPFHTSTDAFNDAVSVAGDYPMNEDEYNA